MMQNILHIKKSTGLDELLERYVPQVHEMPTPVHADRNPMYDVLLQKWKFILENYPRLDIVHPGQKQVYGRITAYVEEVLHPQQFPALLAALMPSESHAYFHRYAGLVLSRLIQNSYDANHNHFILPLSVFPVLNYIGSFLRGTDEKPLSLLIRGNLGYGAFSESRYVVSMVEGDAGENVAESSRHGIIRIMGNTGENCGIRTCGVGILVTRSTGLNCGIESDGSRVIIEENCGGFGDYARHTTYTLHGKLQSRKTIRGVEDCTYRVSDRKLAESLLRRLPPHNKVVYLAEKKEEVTRT